MDDLHTNDKSQRPAATDKLAIVQAGQAMSDPSESGFLKTINSVAGKVEATLAQFTPSEHLLKGLEESIGSKPSDTANGPQFPLRKSYNPETNYLDAAGKPTSRGEQLQAEAKKMVDAAAAPDGSLSLKDHGKMMDAISKQNINEADKWVSL
ncbi:MAG: hypothetical protein P4L53_17530 [Candidatus Obscuribacterales bacterium]|nr:hypothetical protein [Candidatus Obscuribacterales bacterium]